MKDLKRFYVECLRELFAVSAPVRPADIYCNSRLTSSWGYCRNNRNGTFSICISKVLLDDANPDRVLKEVILHELLHTCPGCMNHGSNWLYWARKVNEKYGYNVKRYLSEKEAQLAVPVERFHKSYRLKCTGCGNEIVLYRMCRAVRHPEELICTKCGCRLASAAAA